MTPNKCNERLCPRHLVDPNGVDVCVLYRVSETEKKVRVLNVFDVTQKSCKILRQQLNATIRQLEEENRFAKPTEVYVQKN